MEMRRYLNEEKPKKREILSNFERLQKHFGFLVTTVKASYGELDLQLRDDYFNVYFRGNSLVKVSFLRNGEYAVEIHKKFSQGTRAERRLSDETPGENMSSRLRVKHNELHALLQRETINKLKRNIRKVNYGEEITFEQLLISDNPPNDEFFIIDRQVTDSDLKGKRMDLLALENAGGNRYRFVVIEVKLGKNPELREKVAKQLAEYVSHILDDATFAKYKACYERNYRQKHELGLLDLSHESIEIEQGVRGLVVVGGYSALGSEQAAELTKNHPDIEVEQFFSRLGAGLHFGASAR